MTYTYKTIVTKSKEIKKNVETDYKLGVTAKWSYYIAKAILTPNKDVKKFTFNKASHPTGTHLSRQITKDDYLNMAKRLVDYVERKRALPNYITYKSYKVRTRLYTYMFAKILVYYNQHGQLPKYVDINSKAFTKPTETGNEVYDYFVKKTGLKPKMIDDVCDWVKNKVEYEFYFDDHKSNKEVIDSKSGNCTDLLQFLINIAEALGYKWEVYHVKCNKSGTGHVYGRFKKSGDWFVRDIACIADESRYCVWCEAGNGGTLIAKNPVWFLANLNR